MSCIYFKTAKSLHAIDLEEPNFVTRKTKYVCKDAFLLKLHRDA